MNPNGSERRNTRRRELDHLKLDILKRSAELDPTDPDHQEAIQQSRTDLHDMATKYGIAFIRMQRRECSSCTGKGTGLLCSQCAREVADERDTLRARIQELEGSVAGKDVQIEQLKSDLRLGVVRELDELRARVKALEAERERLRGDMSQMKCNLQRSMDMIDAALKTTPSRDIQDDETKVIDKAS